ncbi:hypothetical protein DQ354_09120 [Arthrobacter sp. AQ5-06]|nr:hypothetical protein DQ354_09120 [Arthrobacter sp. AQ5-06]
MHGPSQPRPPHVGRPTPRFRPGGCRRFLAVVLIAAVYMLAPARPGKGAASRTSTGIDIDTFANTARIDAGLDLHQRSASLDDPLGAFTSGFQIQTMGQDSNNDSWSLLMDAVGLSGLSEYAASIDVTYDLEVNTLSTADMAHVLAELFEGRLLDQEPTEQLLS